MKFVCFSLLLLVLMAELGCAMNRRMVLIEANSRRLTPSVQRTGKEKAEVVKENLDGNDDADINNHHNIPRQSYGGWDDNQNGSDQPADNHN
ncbi:hypothetical protein Patl1_32227 [Pistacia atlantica]|uniref:Uncharacterized protein n=1 Tax=Pistacia atlantica TaxID=434234 RepID=A0ACC1AQK7_9ROSI|nr:hypothetical protein Patl1_32227 [Pistacia atlantica]